MSDEMQATVETSDQSAAVNDFVNVEYVPEDIDVSQDIDAQSKDGISAETDIVNKLNGQTPANPAQPAQGQNTQTQQPAQAQNQTDDSLMGMFTKDGNLDIDSFLKFSTPHQSFQQQAQATQAQNIPAAPAASAPAAPVDPVAEYVRQEKEYRDNVYNNMTASFGMIQKYIQAGYDVNGALHMARQEMLENLNGHFSERSMQREAERQRQLEEKMESQLRKKELRSSRERTEAMIFNEYGGEKIVTALLRNDDFAGKFINMLHDSMRPDKAFSKLKGDEFVNEREDWFDSFFSNPQNYRMVLDASKAWAFFKNKDQLVRAIRENNAGQKAQTQRSVPSRTAGYSMPSQKQQQAQAATAQRGAKDWINSEPRFDRIN